MLDDPTVAALAAGAFWVGKGLNAQAAGPLTNAQYKSNTRIVNGGLTGFSARWDYYQSATRAIKQR
jgi:predicted chitinase